MIVERGPKFTEGMKSEAAGDRNGRPIQQFPQSAQTQQILINRFLSH
jgi:hypothetical protein